MSEDAYARLKSLLLAEERAEQQAQAARLAELEEGLRQLPAQLPQAIEQADAAGPRLGRSLLKPVATALTALARHDKQLFVSVLFPVIGPIIRRAIADAFASLVRNLNRTLEHSLSWRSWRWRWESWRTGVPFAQVVLKHTLAYRIEHLLWVEEGSGLLLAHATNSDAEIADRDAIAGMLTAISDFVRDAVLQRGEEALDRVEMGAFSVRLLRTPMAYLAVVVRGEPAQRVLDGLRDLSETLHAELGPAPRNYSSSAEAALADWLAQSGQSEALRESGGAPRGRGRMWLLAVLVVALAVGWGVRSWQHHRDYLRVRAVLAAEPGLRVEDIARVDGQWRVRGQRDPLAVDDATLAARLGLLHSQWHSEWSPWVSTEPVILARRMQQRLQAPAEVQVEATPTGLILRGAWPDPPADLDLRIESYRALIPVQDLLQRGLPPPPPPAPFDVAAWRSKADALAPVFPVAASQLPLQDPQLENLSALADLLQETLQVLPEARFTLVGSSDGSGSAALNQNLRRARASWVHAQLVAAGVPEDRLDIDPMGHSAVLAAADARRVWIRLRLPP